MCVFDVGQYEKSTSTSSGYQWWFFLPVEIKLLYLKWNVYKSIAINITQI